MSAKRLTEGGRIDRSRPLSFTWDGRPLEGFSGDSLASALMANNQLIIGRSFKYHRPRGITSCGVEESGALVSLGRGDRLDPNVKATTQELFDGLIASGQNAWLSVRYDLGAINNLFSRFLAAGFYYKTFMGLPPFETGKGTGYWMWYEKLIRKAAGMGEASRSPDPDSYEHGHLFCDLLVVGAGPAGLSAAINAADCGLDVILVEQDHQLGGDLLGQNTAEAESLRNEMVASLEKSAVRIMTRTTAFGLYDNGTAGLLERVSDHLQQPRPHEPRQRFWTLRAAQTILCCGALERQIAFNNNDRPGVMNAAAGRHYLNRYAVLPGEQIVIATNNDSVYQCAAQLALAGVAVSLLDCRKDITAELAASATDHGVELLNGCAPLSANGARGIKSIEIAGRSGAAWQPQRKLPCDCLLVSGGWSPVINLVSHRGVKPQWHAELACFLVHDQHEGIQLVGSAVGIWSTEACIESGAVAANHAAKALGQEVGDQNATYSMPSPGGWKVPIEPLYEVKISGRKSKAFVDLQHDVSSDDIRLAHREGYVSVEHLKRYTTLGMATDGGKMGNIIGLALMAEAQGKQIPEVGTTTFRPPYTPVAIGALSGRSVDQHFRPLRRTPMHDWNLAHGATMTMAGLWHRPWYFARSGETIDEAYIREAGTTRKSVGLCDVTSLGKIAVQGPDATEFLNRVYTNPFAKLPVGKARYGIMLRDDGIVMDDGTTWRLSDTDYFMTTTTANAAKVMSWLEQLLQTRWSDLRVHVTSVSEQWAACALAGPKARDVLSECVEDAATVTNTALPFMGVIQSRLKGAIACRIARISFSGELAYEIYVPSDYGSAMMELLYTQVRSAKGCLYGLEALGTLRIEKGHVTGAELDGRVTLEDAGLGKMASPDKSYIGSALRQRPQLMRDDRPQLAGFFPTNRNDKFNAGSIVCEKEAISGMGEGWITGVTFSPELEHWIGIGFIRGGHDCWQNQSVIAADPVRDSSIEVEVVSPHMVDPDGEQLHG